MLRLAVFLAIAHSLPSLHAAQEDWPHWRGPQGNGVSPEEGWRAQGAAEPLWQEDVGLGYSSPSILDGVLFILGYRAELGGDQLQARDAETGELRWSQSYPAELRNFDHGGGSLTTPAGYSPAK